MKLVPKTLGGQLVVMLLVALVLAQTISFVIQMEAREDAVRRADRIGLLERTASMMRVLDAAPPELRRRLATKASSRRLQFWITPESVVEATSEVGERSRLARLFEGMIGDRLAQPPRLVFLDPDGDEVSLRAMRGRGRPHHDDDDDERRRYRPHPRHRPWDRFDVIMSVPFRDGGWLNAQTNIRAEPVAWGWPSAVSAGAMALFILLIVGVMARRATRPLTELAAAAEAFGRGARPAPLAETGPQEVRRLTHAFNQMQERLSRFVADRTRMMAAIGHDLRTPITALKLRAELVDDADNRERMCATLDDMQRMTEATLRFAGDDAGEEPSRVVDLASLVASVAADRADLGEDVAFEEAGRLPYRCRPLALRRALGNLVENAVRYAGAARIRIEPRSEGPRIVVEDRGPGIPDNRLEDVFKPFVRLEESRSRETGGSGLGLAIARSLVLAHGGTLTLANRDGGGLTAIIQLPAGAGP